MSVPMDLEARAHAAHPEALRLWLRLLTCTQLIERDVRIHLRESFDTTLPRFDLMAQLERNPEGLRMSVLSQRLMVTGGNVTGIVEQLVQEGLVTREQVPSDRRAFHIRLTPRGRSEFRAMAKAHERWIVDAFAGLSGPQMGELHAILGQLKARYLEQQ